MSRNGFSIILPIFIMYRILNFIEENFGKTLTNKIFFFQLFKIAKLNYKILAELRKKT